MKFKLNPKQIQSNAMKVGAGVGGAIAASFVATKVPESIKALKDKPQVVQGLILAGALVGEGMTKDANIQAALRGASIAAGMKLAASYSPEVKKQLGLAGYDGPDTLAGSVRFDWQKLASEAASEDREAASTYSKAVEMPEPKSYTQPEAHDRYRPQMGEIEEIEYLFA